MIRPLHSSYTRLKRGYHYFDTQGYHQEFKVANAIIIRWKIRQPGCLFGSVFLLLPIRVARGYAHRSQGKSLALSDSPEHSNIIVVSKAILQV